MDGYGLVQIRSKNGQMYDLGIVTGIRDTLMKAISAIPIPNLPTDSAFALESNTSNSYTVQFSRKNPLKYVDGVLSTYESDEDYNVTSWKWTNARWSEALMSLVNRWQIKTDGYLMYINTDDAKKYGNDASWKNTGNYAPQTKMLPSSHMVNVFVQDVEIDLDSGDSEYLTGTITVVVGGRLTEKLSESNTDAVKFRTVTGDFDKNLRWTTSIPIVGPIPDPAQTYVPIFDGEHAKECYNALNEYNERIYSGSSYIKLQVPTKYKLAILQRPTFILTAGMSREEEDVIGAEGTTYGGLDLVNSYSLTGGPEEPFEHISLKLSKRAFVRTYPVLANKLMDDSGPKSEIAIGESVLDINAIGRGKFVVTECALRENSFNMTAYCGISCIRGIALSAEHRWSDPLTMIINIIGTDDFSKSGYYRPEQIICNVDGDVVKENRLKAVLGEGYGLSEINSQDIENLKTEQEKLLKNKEYVDVTLTTMLETDTSMLIRPVKGSGLWSVLQLCAMMCNARVFFANGRAYVIDYTKLDSEVSEADGGDPEVAFNRLIVRSGLDRGLSPADGWNIASDPNYTTDEQRREAKALYDSVELHSECTYDRLSGRVYGTVTQDSQGSTTAYNTVIVKYNIYVQNEVGQQPKITTRTI